MGAVVMRRWTGVLRAKLPAVASSGLKNAVLTWGWMTSSQRMEPAFLVIGAQRCGTTSLFRVLSKHPDVIRPLAWKGIGFFDVNYAQGRRWYIGHFPLRLGRGQKVTFESSGYYAFHPCASTRIRRELPHAKVVLMVRNPVDRAHSAHRHESARGFEGQTFADALELEPQRLVGEVERILRDPTYESFEHRHHAYLERGRYIDQLERFARDVGREKIYVVDADRLFAEPKMELAALFGWLGLSSWLPESFDQWNARPRDPLDLETRLTLEAHFEEADQRLAEFMGRTPSWRDQ